MRKCLDLPFSSIAYGPALSPIDTTEFISMRFLLVCLFIQKFFHPGVDMSKHILIIHIHILLFLPSPLCLLHKFPVTPISQFLFNKTICPLTNPDKILQILLVALPDLSDGIASRHRSLEHNPTDAQRNNTSSFLGLLCCCCCCCSICSRDIQIRIGRNAAHQYCVLYTRNQCALLTL